MVVSVAKFCSSFFHTYRLKLAAPLIRQCFIDKSIVPAIVTSSRPLVKNVRNIYENFSNGLLHPTTRCNLAAKPKKKALQGKVTPKCPSKDPCGPIKNPCDPCKPDPCAPKPQPCPPCPKKDPCAPKDDPCKRKPCSPKKDPCGSKKDPCAPKKKPCDPCKPNPCAPK